jgi:hypothetical protein
MHKVQVSIPLECFRKAWIIVVVLRSPDAISELETVANGPVAPLLLSGSTARTGRDKTVLHHVVLIEFGAKPIITVRIQRKLRNYLAEAATVGRIPRPAFGDTRINARRFEHLYIVGYCNGVPVLGQSVTVAIARP